MIYPQLLACAVHTSLDLVIGHFIKNFSTASVHKAEGPNSVHKVRVFVLRCSSTVSRKASSSTIENLSNLGVLPFSKRLNKSCAAYSLAVLGLYASFISFHDAIIALKSFPPPHMQRKITLITHFSSFIMETVK